MAPDPPKVWGLFIGHTRSSTTSIPCAVAPTDRPTFMPTRLNLLAVTIAVILAQAFVRAEWQAGVAKADITPTEPVPLAGYAGKTRMSERIEHPIWLKALAIRHDEQTPAVIVTADLVGLSKTMADRIAAQALAEHGIPRERLILNSSHNHSCPVTEDVLWLYYELTPEESAAKDRYTSMVYKQYAEVIRQSIKDLAPAHLAFEQGLAGVAVNRRRARGPESRSLGNQVDQDVPVLAIRSGQLLKGILFGYSCHTTALGGLSINGDYAGFAQLELEKRHPSAIALFMQNCGGDANPLPRIRGKARDDDATSLAAKYGEILAESVSQVLSSPMTALSGPLQTVMETPELELRQGLPQEQLLERAPNLSGLHRREFDHFIRQYKDLGALPGRIHYPIQLWNFGKELSLIALTGETVADYSLNLKALYGWNTTWVSGYNNDLTSYIPSSRILKEGGYEGTTGMYEYGHRAPYTDDVESRINSAVSSLYQKINR